MNNSKLVSILRTFSGSEMKEFEKAVLSPFFNRGRNYLPLLKLLKKFHPKFDNDKLTAEYLFERLYPGKKINKQPIWNMCSALLVIAEEYLAIHSLGKNKFLKNQRIADELHTRKLSDYFSKKLAEMEKGLEQRGMSPDYFLYKKNVDSGWKEYYYMQEKQLSVADRDDKEGEYLAHYFLWSILRGLNDMHIHSFMYNTKYELSITLEFIRSFDMEKFISYCKEKKYKNTWLFEMYYCQIMMIRLEFNEGLKYFRKLRELYEANFRQFTLEAKKDWMACLVNFCAFKSDLKTRRTLFELHNFELKEGLSFTGKFLQRTYFLLVLKNAIALREIEWIKGFIDEFVPKLQPLYQKPMHAIGFAYLYLLEKDYPKVYECLGKVRFADIKDKMTVKLIYMRAYYESNETEALLSQIDTTWHFLNNNAKQIRGDIAENHRVLLRNVKKLISIKENNELHKLDEIKKSIEENPAMILREWLSRVVDELEKGAF